MATNPMQRKARTSFLLGMVITLLITGVIIAFLLMQLMQIKKKEREEALSMVSVSVLNKEVKSGEEIDSSYFTTAQVLYQNAPTDYITAGDLGEKNIAKIAMTPGTIVSKEMVYIDEEKLTNDVRREEYNMIVLPIDLQSGEYIDIRLMLPTGENYIVLSKQIVEIPNINGAYSEDTIYLELSEDEILSLGSAIIEAYWIEGAKLYANKYVEPGMQEAAKITYPPKTEIVRLINEDPNVLADAKTALANRYNTNQRNGTLNNAINAAGEQGGANVKTNIQESITTTKEDRKEYLETLY